MNPKETPDRYTPPEQMPDAIPQPFVPEIAPTPFPVINGALRKIRKDEEGGGFDVPPAQKPTIH